MHHLRRLETVEVRGGGVAVRANVLRVEQIVDLQPGQFLGLNDGVHAVAGLSEYRADFGVALFESVDAILAVVEHDAGKRVIHAVVDVVV